MEPEIAGDAARVEFAEADGEIAACKATGRGATTTLRTSLPVRASVRTTNVVRVATLVDNGVDNGSA